VARECGASPSQPDLFMRPDAPEPAPETAPDPLRSCLAEVDPDALSPRDALDLVYRLRSLAGD
jgi:DNA mismatch repair protein MutS